MLYRRCLVVKMSRDSLSVLHWIFQVFLNEHCCCYFQFVTFRLLPSTEIGMGLTGFGVFFLFFGMMLFFDKALLAIGNVRGYVILPNLNISCLI